MDTATGSTREPRTGTGAGLDGGFAALFDESFEAMRRLAYLLGADDPENIAQESFVRLHGRWHTLASADLALPYLRRTVVNLSRSRLREVLAGLPTRQRQVLVLRYWLDLDQNEIAGTLGIAVGTVKATASHALANLRKAWPEREEGRCPTSRSGSARRWAPWPTRSSRPRTRAPSWPAASTPGGGRAGCRRSRPPSRWPRPLSWR